MDYYSILGGSKNASTDDIKKAYRKLASQHHPDRGGDTKKFQEIQAAYDTLGDPDKRSQYDNPMQGMPGGFGFQFNNFDINDIFGHMFGQRQQHHPGKQIFRTAITITLEDVLNGASKVLKIHTQTGQKMVNIEVPKGIPDSSQIKYDNIIDNAILLVEFRILPHLKFERRGSDLLSNHQISILDLIVGTKFEFTTMSGKTLEVSVAPKTQPYVQLKIPGQGLPIYQSNSYGDQIILLKPYMPTTIDQEITDSILRAKQK